jgi:dTDP-4-dehydrorhamnose reductase
MEIWGGIECTINRIGNQYFDQLDYNGHYARKEDLKLVCDLGIKKIRYPILWEKNQPNENEPITWAVEDHLNYIKKRNVDVIAGLVHHGSGPNYASILDDAFANKLAVYAEKVAAKFPWINYYTPVNEPLTTARFCGLYGIWYPHEKDSLTFLKILINECKATILAMQAIRKVNPLAKLIQTEDLAKIHSTKILKYQADFENERRWLSLDLLCGKVNAKHPLWNFIISCGIKQNELQFFLENPMPPDILGFNYYITSERFLDENLEIYPKSTHGGNGQHLYADVEAIRTEKTAIAGPEELLLEAWNRYKIPLAITEAHLHCGREEQLRWLQNIWSTASKLQLKNVQINAVTAWSLLGAYGWNKLLTIANGSYEAGAFDVSTGKLRPTAITKQIKAFSLNEPFKHPLNKCPGWWERSDRILYGEKNKFNSLTKPKDCQPVLIIGATGTLGKAFIKLCNDRGIYYKALSRKNLDLTNSDQINHFINICKPWAVINAAGFVRVDDAETEYESCYLSNTNGPENLAICCEKYGVKLLTFSSDLVFDGEKKTGYTEDDKVNPLNVYGLSKAKAEQRILKQNADALIIRTSAFFSTWDEYNFVYYVLNSLKNQQQIKIADDVFISPTYVPDLVNASLNLLIDDEKGIWHLANGGILTWFDLAKDVAERAKLDKKYLEATPVELLGLKAKRPNYSALISNKGMRLPSLEHALNDFFNNYTLN